MSVVRHGGFAFPVIPPVDDDGCPIVGYPSASNGMSLRQWYAGQALVGISREDGFYNSPGTMPATMIARRALEIADALILAEEIEMERGRE